jgi:energy-coupling factor transporter ATP-binding protein EcfA2
VIQSVEIKGFRGVREGKLCDLTPLVVLVGPNGSGKSTVLEAILLGASPNPGDALAEVYRRHEPGGSGPRWLLWRAGRVESAVVSIVTDTGENRKCELRLAQGLPQHQTQLNVFIHDGVNYKGQVHLLASNNKYHTNTSDYLPMGTMSEVHLVEAYPTSSQRPLHDLYAKAVELGRRTEAIEIISEVVPLVSNVEILTEQGQPILHLVFPGFSVPATLAGDGVQSLLRLSLELAASGGGTALMEEPEVHQHPGAIRQSARAILAAVRRQVQVVLTTHSLELIDALVSDSSDADLELMSLYSVRLHDGVLMSSRLAGPDVALSRTTIQDDLR